MKALVLSLLPLALATAPVGTGIIRHDRPESRYLALAASPQFAPVGHLLLAGRSGGSGTLIAPRWFITAAHVVTDRADGQTTVDSVASLQVVIGGDTVAVTRVVVHPGYWNAANSGANDVQARKGEDVALLQLARAPRGVAPAHYGGSSGARGKVATYVGYGASGDAFTFLKQPLPSGTKRAGTNVIDSLGAVFDDRHLPAWNLVADFDSPGIAGTNHFGSDQPTDLEIQPAGGDSGGGVFLEVDGGWSLIGVFYGSIFDPEAPEAQGAYGMISLAVAVDHLLPWIRATLGE
jgi:hypothetical protein